MVKISNLLKWHDSVTLKDEKGEEIIDPETKKPVKVFLRILGDADIEECYRIARVKSAEVRANLRNPESNEYKDQVATVENSDREACITLIKATRTNLFNTEATTAVERPELPKIEEFAADPDAPTLEEQEKFDAAVKQGDIDYLEALDKYTKERLEALDAELSQMDEETLREETKREVSNLNALTTYLNEIIDQKVYRGTYIDNKFTRLAFDSIDEYRNTSSVIKDQIREAYLSLELEPDKLKN